MRNQIQQLRRSLRGLEREGFRYVHKLSSPEEIEAVTIERQPLWNNKRDEHGPFDIIGDVHGCLDELLELMAALGYEVERNEKEFSVSLPMAASWHSSAISWIAVPQRPTCCAWR